MPSTITLNTTVNWASAIANFENLTIGTGNEPAISNANVIAQTILGPPFKWIWNRVAINFFTTSGIQDTAVSSLSNFGFLEGASATLSGTTFAFKEVKTELTVGTEIGRPQSIAAQFDNNAGQITFRTLPVSDANYTVTAHIQQAPIPFTSLSQTWAPIPDKFQYIYSYGFLALSMAYVDDQRFPIFNQKFVAHLLGAQQGLTETERNMFLDTWNLISRQENLMAIKTQQGRAAMGT